MKSSKVCFWLLDGSQQQMTHGHTKTLSTKTLSTIFNSFGRVLKGWGIGLPDRAENNYQTRGAEQRWIIFWRNEINRKGFDIFDSRITNTKT